MPRERTILSYLAEAFNVFVNVEARTAHPPASRREDSSREGPVWQALSGHKRSNTLAVELPPQAGAPGP